MDCWISHVALASLAILFSTVVHAEPTLSVTLENRFRLLADGSQEKLYAQDLNERLTCRGARCESESAIRNRRGGNKNFATRWSAESWSFESDYTSDLRRTARLKVDGIPHGRCDWVVKVEPDGETVSVNGHQCDERVRLPELRKAERRLDISVEVHVESPQWIGDLAPDHVRFRDVVVVTLDDSFLSGEGNPNVNLRYPVNGGSYPQGMRSEWLDVRCHRSLFTSGAIASFKLAQAHPTQSVTFIPLACSGAEIGEGLLKANYLGRETPFQAINFPGSEGEQYEAFSNVNVFSPASCLPAFGAPNSCVLPSQIDTLKETLCSENGCTRPDVVIVSSGGNELGFGNVVAQIARRPPPIAKTKVLSEVQARLKRLPQMFDNFRDRVMTFQPRNVIAMGYLDPTQRAANEFCADVNGKVGDRTFVPNWSVGLGFGITKDWAKFARNEILLPLNRSIRKSVEKYERDGWKYASLSQVGHGYCSPKSWFLNFQT